MEQSTNNDIQSDMFLDKHIVFIGSFINQADMMIS